MDGREIEYIMEAYRSNWMSTVGENINEIERLLCERVGCKYAVALSTGTSALHLSMKLSGIRPGSRAFCSTLTFAATANPIVYVGGVPIFIDSERETWNLDPELLEKAFASYPDVRHVVAVNLFGTPGRLDEIRDICRRHGADAGIAVNVRRNAKCFLHFCCIAFHT